MSVSNFAGSIASNIAFAAIRSGAAFLERSLAVLFAVVFLLQQVSQGVAVLGVVLHEPRQFLALLPAHEIADGEAEFLAFGAELDDEGLDRLPRLETLQGVVVGLVLVLREVLFLMRPSISPWTFRKTPKSVTEETDAVYGRPDAEGLGEGMPRILRELFYAQAYVPVLGVALDHHRPRSPCRLPARRKGS